MVDALDSPVCADCGLFVAKGKDQAVFHVEEPPDDWEPHDASLVTTRREYLYGRAEKAAAEKTPAARQADALERIASALEKIVVKFYQQ